MASDTAPQTRGERLLGLGNPTSRSRFWFAYTAVAAVLVGGWFLWRVLTGGWDGGQGFIFLGTFVMALCSLCDGGGAFLYLRRGVAWGRSLRVFGYAIFLPLSLALWMIGSWAESSEFFAYVALISGFSVAVVAIRAAKMLRRDARGQGGR